MFGVGMVAIVAGAIVAWAILGTRIGDTVRGGKSGSRAGVALRTLLGDEVENCGSLMLEAKASIKLINMLF